MRVDNFETTKLQFQRVYPDITFSTIVFLDSKEKASYHGVITFDREEEGQNGSYSYGLEEDDGTKYGAI